MSTLTEIQNQIRELQERTLAQLEAMNNTTTVEVIEEPRSSIVTTSIPTLSGRQTPWESNPLQQSMDRLSATDAIVASGLDYPIVKEQLMIPRTGQLTDAFAVGREVNYPNGDSEFVHFGTVSADYTVMQSMEIAERLDPITKEYPIVSIGADHSGANIHMFLSAGRQSIAGEDHELYFIIKDSRNGRRGLSFSFMPLRLACKNGLVFYKAEGGASATFHHIKSINEDVSTFSETLLPRMAYTMSSAIEQFNRMAEVKVNDEEVNTILASAYPEPRLPRNLRHLVSGGNSLMMGLTEEVRTAQLEEHPDYAKYLNTLEGVNDLKDNVLKSYDSFNQAYSRKNLDNTAWAVYNSICEVEDHGRRTRGNGMPSIIGERVNVKARSFKKACELIA